MYVQLEKLVKMGNNLYPYQLKRCNISEELNIERHVSPEYMYFSFHLIRNEPLELGM